jgi:hypothetical protein
MVSQVYPHPRRDAPVQSGTPPLAKGDINNNANKASDNNNVEMIDLGAVETALRGMDIFFKFYSCFELVCHSTPDHHPLATHPRALPRPTSPFIYANPESMIQHMTLIHKTHEFI